MGTRVRLRGGRAAVAVGGVRGAARAGRLRRRAQADLAAGRPDRRRADGLQPVPDLVLAGGTVLRAGGAAERRLPARLRLRQGDADIRPGDRVGARRGARAGHPLLLVAGGHPRGRVAVVGPPLRAPGAARDRFCGRVRAGTVDTGHQSERERAREVDFVGAGVTPTRRGRAAVPGRLRIGRLQPAGVGVDRGVRGGARPPGGARRPRGAPADGGRRRGGGQRTGLEPAARRRRHRRSADPQRDRAVDAGRPGGGWGHGAWRAPAGSGSRWRWRCA